MNNHLIKKIRFFTLQACPLGRSMGTVLHEISEQFPELPIETTYVDEQIDTTNHYRVKKNPTVLFTDKDDNELYRLEGFHETDLVAKTIHQINRGEIKQTQAVDKNAVTEEKYIIYHLKENKLSPVEVVYKNQTSIKAPRITVVNLLIQTSIEAYDNPFPQGTTLERIEFQNTKGIMTLKLEREVHLNTIKLMKQALKLTLSHFGINEVELILQ